MPALTTTDLTKCYGDVTAINSISITVPEGSVYGLLGPNGAGKSTLIDILLDYVKPTSGAATVCGHDAQSESVAAHEHIGVLPDGFDVFQRLTGRRHITYVADARDVEVDPDEQLERVGLGENGSQLATEYSRGMQQRLGLAMALVGNPDLLLLDEPFAGLDPDGVRLLRQCIADAHRRGSTVFVSSHRLEQVERACTEIALLMDGSILAKGEPNELLAEVRNENQYAVSVEGPAEEAAQALDKMAICQNVVVEGTTLRVTCVESTDAETVRKEFRKAGMSVTQVREVEPDLEDLYTAHTTGKA